MAIGAVASLAIPRHRASLALERGPAPAAPDAVPAYAPIEN